MVLSKIKNPTAAAVEFRNLNFGIKFKKRYLAKLLGVGGGGGPGRKKCSGCNHMKDEHTQQKIRRHMFQHNAASTIGFTTLPTNRVSKYLTVDNI